MIHNATGWLDRFMFEPATLPLSPGAAYLQIEADHWVLDILEKGNPEQMIYLYIMRDDLHYYLVCEEGITDARPIYFLRINFNYARFRQVLNALNIMGNDF